MSYFKKSFTALTLLLLPMVSLAQEDSPDDVFRLVYKARLSEKDHFSSSGQRLKKAVEILRQDRANFHVFNIKDTEDESDETFKDKEARAYMEKSIYIPPKVEKSILNGTPIVKVELVGDGGSVSLITENGAIDKGAVKSSEEGLVEDSASGLTWMRCSLGQNWDGRTCSGKAKQYTWKKAMNASKHFKYAGYSDWRLPTIDELKTIVYCSNGYDDDGCSDNSKNPTIRSDQFPNTPNDSFWWSSSPYSDISSRAWGVFFDDGHPADYDKSNGDHYVRLVR